MIELSYINEEDYNLQLVFISVSVFLTSSQGKRRSG